MTASSEPCGSWTRNSIRNVRQLLPYRIVPSLRGAPQQVGMTRADRGGCDGPDQAQGPGEDSWDIGREGSLLLQRSDASGQVPPAILSPLLPAFRFLARFQYLRRDCFQASANKRLLSPTLYSCLLTLIGVAYRSESSSSFSNSSSRSWSV